MLHLDDANNTCGEEVEGRGETDSWDFLQKTIARERHVVPFFLNNKCIIFRDQKETLTAF